VNFCVDAMWFGDVSSWALWSDNPYNTIFYLIVLYNLVFKNLDSKWNTKHSGPKRIRHSLSSHCFSFLHKYKFWFISVGPKYLKFTTFSKDILPIFTLWYCPAFCPQHMYTHFVLSALTSWLPSLLMTSEAAVFCLYSLYTVTNKLTSSA